MHDIVISVISDGHTMIARGWLDLLNLVLGPHSVEKLPDPGGLHV